MTETILIALLLLICAGTFGWLAHYVYTESLKPMDKGDRFLLVLFTAMSIGFALTALAVFATPHEVVYHHCHCHCHCRH